MLARFGTSCGASEWCVPWRERKAMGTELWERMVMGEEGVPQGVEGVREATGVKPSRCWRPVPPMTAMWTGPWADELGYCELCLLRGGGGDKRGLKAWEGWV
jgi:hypothetical protein